MYPIVIRTRMVLRWFYKAAAAAFPTVSEGRRRSLAGRGLATETVGRDGSIYRT